MLSEPVRPLGSRCISVAVMSGLLCVPVVIAAGLLTDGTKGDGVPADITVSLLRRTLDAVSCNLAYGAAVPAKGPGELR